MSKSMEDIWKAITKQHGDEGLFHGNDDMTTFVDVISTGSYGLDDALGIWGLPRGRVIQFAGAESSGKTFMSLIAIAEYQRTNPTGWALFIDAEYTWDSEWAASLGVDLDRVMVYRENSAVKIFERLVGRMKKGKKEKQGILDLELESPTGLGIIVLDSIAFLQPPIEENSEMEKQNISPLARFLPVALRRLTPALSDTGVTFIGINQIRVDPSVMYGNPEGSPGGKALKHACSVMLNFAAINKEECRIYDENKERIGHKVRVKVGKNKLAPPFRQAEVAILYTEGVTDKNVELRDLGGKYGVLERPNNKTWIFDGEKYGGKDAMASALLDPDVQKDVFERVKVAKAEQKINNTLSNNDYEEVEMEEEQV